MIRFAIVEDDDIDANTLLSNLNSCFENKGIEFSVDRYCDGPSFLEKFSSNYDLIFLDVEMKPLSGFDVAEQIRLIDSSILLIFVTNMSQLARQGYKYAAFDYLPKPVELSELHMTLTRALTQINTNENRTILISGKNKEKIAISLSDLTYLEVNGHYITFHTTQGNYEQYGVFKKVLEEIDLPDYFVKCNQCFVVNMKFIEKIFKDSVVVNGDTLNISRPQKKTFFESYTSFISGRRKA